MHAISAEIVNELSSQKILCDDYSVISGAGHSLIWLDWVILWVVSEYGQV